MHKLAVGVHHSGAVGLRARKHGNSYADGLPVAQLVSVVRNAIVGQLSHLLWVGISSLPSWTLRLELFWFL